MSENLVHGKKRFYKTTDYFNEIITDHSQRGEILTCHLLEKYRSGFFMICLYLF